MWQWGWKSITTILQQLRFTAESLSWNFFALKRQSCIFRKKTWSCLKDSNITPQKRFSIICKKIRLQCLIVVSTTSICDIIVDQYWALLGIVKIFVNFYMSKLWASSPFYEVGKWLASKWCDKECKLIYDFKAGHLQWT